MTIQIADLKRSVDLLSLIGRDTRLVKVAGTRGGEYAGPCSFCGGRDRFRVQPEHGLWFCRNGCSDGRWQDVIVYVRQRDGCTFTEAVERLGTSFTLSTKLDERDIGKLPKSTRTTVDNVISCTEPPSADWQAAARDVLDRCQDWLWSDDGDRARGWLNQRGLNDGTIAAWDLGYCPADCEIAGFRVERGIAIPWQVEDVLWSVKVRRPQGEPKYRALKGSKPFLFGVVTLLDQHRIVLLTEGEFDCMLAHQEAGGLVGVLTLGDCSKGLPAEALRYLLPAEKVLVAYDTDEAGEKGAAKLAALSGRMVRVRPPNGKDVTDYWQAGGNVRDWITYELARLGHGAAA